MNFLNKWLPIFFGCHQMPDRSFCYRGKQFPICARCTGLLVGFILFTPFVIYVPHNAWFLLYFLLPIIVDGVLQRYTRYTSNNILRLITGILGGIGMLLIFYYIAVTSYEFGYNLGLKNK